MGKSFLESMPQTAHERQQAELAQQPMRKLYDARIGSYAVGEAGYFLPTAEEVEAAFPMLRRSGHVIMPEVKPMDSRPSWTAGCLLKVDGFAHSPLAGNVAMAGGAARPIGDHRGMMNGEAGTFPTVLPPHRHIFFDVQTSVGQVAAHHLLRMIHMLKVSTALRNQGYLVFATPNKPSLRPPYKTYYLTSSARPLFGSPVYPAPQRLSVLLFCKAGEAHWYEAYFGDGEQCVCREYQYNAPGHVQRICQMDELLAHFGAS